MKYCQVRSNDLPRHGTRIQVSVFLIQLGKTREGSKTALLCFSMIKLKINLNVQKSVAEERNNSEGKFSLLKERKWENKNDDGRRSWRSEKHK